MSKKYNILIIDDEQVILDSVVKICSGEGYETDSAINAQVAIQKIETQQYQLIICDIMMPEMDGFQFLEELRIKNIETPLIMTTGYSTVETAVKSLYSGAIDFLPKPFSFEELVSSVKRGLRFGDIQKTIINSFHKSPDSSVAYVPCPAVYMQLGYYSWINKEPDGTVKIGVTDLFLKTINAITGIEMVEVDQDIIQGSSGLLIETEDGLIHNVLSPLSGKVIESNAAVLNDYTLIEKDPYFKGWIYSLIPSDLEYETKHLIPCSSDRSL
jgi:CheY-like chemotaxis protein